MARDAAATFMIVPIGVNATPIAALEADRTEIATAIESMVGTVITTAMLTDIMPIPHGIMPTVGPTTRREVGTGSTDRVARDHQQAALTAHHAVTTAISIALGTMDDLEAIGHTVTAEVLAAIGRPARTAPLETSAGRNMDHLAGRKDLRTEVPSVDLRISIAFMTTGLDRQERKPIADDRTVQTVARPIRTGAMMTIDRGG